MLQHFYIVFDFAEFKMGLSSKYVEKEEEEVVVRTYTLADEYNPLSPLILLSILLVLIIVITCSCYTFILNLSKEDPDPEGTLKKLEEDKEKKKQEQKKRRKTIAVTLMQNQDKAAEVL